MQNNDKTDNAALAEGGSDTTVVHASPASHAAPCLRTPQQTGFPWNGCRVELANLPAYWCENCRGTAECESCHQAPATENWGGNYDQLSLARNQSLIQRWCRRCVITAQLAHMRPMVERISELERELAALAKADGK